jgi:hypothetical protein
MTGEERLVEAVARAMCAGRAVDPDALIGPDQRRWWQCYELEARAVLAMPELAAGLRLAKAADGYCGAYFAPAAYQRDVFMEALAAYRATRGSPR